MPARHVPEAVGSVTHAPAIHRLAVPLAHQGRYSGATEEIWFAGSMTGMTPPGMQQGSGMFDDDCDEATVLAACRDGPRLAYSEIGTLANLNWFLGDVSSPAPRLKHARSRTATRSTPIVDSCFGTGPGQARALRDGLRTETGITADGRHT